MRLSDRLRKVIYDRAGGGPSESNYDPELLDVGEEAARAIDRLHRALLEFAPHTSTLPYASIDNYEEVEAAAEISRITIVDLDNELTKAEADRDQAQRNWSVAMEDYHAANERAERAEAALAECMEDKAFLEMTVNSLHKTLFEMARKNAASK